MAGGPDSIGTSAAGTLRAPTLGQRVRSLRHAKGLTLALLSGAAELSISYLNDVEHDRTLPRMAALHRIATALGINVRDLLDGVDPFGV